jgi:hypothetical protein
MFDLDVVTQKTNEGRLKLYLGIDKVRKKNGESLDIDTLNNNEAQKIGFKRFRS